MTRETCGPVQWPSVFLTNFNRGKGGRPPPPGSAPEFYTVGNHFSVDVKKSMKSNIRYLFYTDCKLKKYMCM